MVFGNGISRDDPLGVVSPSCNISVNEEMMYRLDWLVQKAVLLAAGYTFRTVVICHRFDHLLQDDAGLRILFWTFTARRLQGKRKTYIDNDRLQEQTSLPPLHQPKL